MANKPKKPWEPGFIPTVGKKPDTGWTAPETPEGWARSDRNDCVMFTRGNVWSREDKIIGKAGCKWRFYRGSEPTHAIHDSWYVKPAAEMFASTSFDNLLRWVVIQDEIDPMPEPRGFAFGGTTTGRGRTGMAQLQQYRKMYSTLPASTLAVDEITAVGTRRLNYAMFPFTPTQDDTDGQESD